MTTYKVTAATGYAGHTEGDTFEADLDPDTERRAVERGSIKKHTQSKKPKPEEEEVDDG